MLFCAALTAKSKSRKSHRVSRSDLWRESTTTRWSDEWWKIEKRDTQLFCLDQSALNYNLGRIANHSLWAQSCLIIWEWNLLWFMMRVCGIAQWNIYDEASKLFLHLLHAFRLIMISTPTRTSINSQKNNNKRNKWTMMTRRSFISDLFRTSLLKLLCRRSWFSCESDKR